MAGFIFFGIFVGVWLLFIYIYNICIYIYIHIYIPGRQCWSLPPTRTMLMFGLVKHRHSQCWCLTPVKKSTDLGTAMKCKIIIHAFIMPISQRVGALGTEFETYKILQVLNRAKHGTLNGLEIYHCQKLMPQINVHRNRELGVATERPDKSPKIFGVE